jgi:exopolyphosphatase/guanosine-5'-triphosphate,3'-diphosphate pyrophosphatase
MEHTGVNQVQAPEAGEDTIVAAVDLGSNSFHLLIARIEGSGFQIIDKLREPVRLAAGLDADGAIDQAARERALECLARFGQRLRGLPSEQVRAVGTNTWRDAVNADKVIPDAENALGHPIEIISGVEEARLIYAGVVHGLTGEQSRRLVADIGGGSTEIIAGHLAQPRLMESLPLGCVTLSEHFFPDGQMGEKAWRAALLHAEREVEPYADLFMSQQWQHAIGASGTVRAIQKVLEAQGWSGFSITREGLKRLCETLRTSKSAKRLKLKGLSARRRDVLPGGTVILAALFEVLGIDSMDVSDAALREGLLLDFAERREHRDIRAQSVRMMAERFGVDLEQAERVAVTATLLLASFVRESPEVEPLSAYLDWAARLHEIGLGVSHAGYHKHGAYIVENADLMGFSRAEQALVAALIRSHRGRLNLDVFESLPPRFRKAGRLLAIALRLAVLLHRGRKATSPVRPRAESAPSSLTLEFPPGWLDEHPLTATDLMEEARALKVVKFKLHFV